MHLSISSILSNLALYKNLPLKGLARSLIIAYKDQALREAEKLDSRLAVPSVLFFFLPFLFLILTPLLMPVMAVLG